MKSTKESLPCSTDTDEIVVVVGLAVDCSGNVLMPLRSVSGTRPLMYELPGGKVEFGETCEEALKRECFEELGADVAVIGPLLDQARFQLEIDFTVFLYPVELKGRAHPLQSVSLHWLDPKYAIVNLPCIPSTYIFYRSIRDWVQYYNTRNEHGLAWDEWRAARRIIERENVGN